MEYESIHRKVARLRAELQDIGMENRKYFETKSHSEAQIMLHHGRQERIVEIKLELEKMLKVKPQ